MSDRQELTSHCLPAKFTADNNQSKQCSNYADSKHLYCQSRLGSDVVLTDA